MDQQTSDETKMQNQNKNLTTKVHNVWLSNYTSTYDTHISEKNQ